MYLGKAPRFFCHWLCIIPQFSAFWNTDLAGRAGQYVAGRAGQYSHSRSPAVIHGAGAFFSVSLKCDQLPLTLTADQVASVLSISRANAYKLMHSKGFLMIRIGKRMIVHRDKLIEWMNAHAYV